MATKEPPPRSVYRIVALLTAAVLILSSLTGYLAMQHWGGAASKKRREEFEAARLDAIRGMVSNKTGLFDNHVDPDVGRILQPGATGLYVGQEIRSNIYGLRERRFEWEKPAGTVRVGPARRFLRVRIRGQAAGPDGRAPEAVPREARPGLRGRDRVPAHRDHELEHHLGVRVPPPAARRAAARPGGSDRRDERPR